MSDRPSYGQGPSRIANSDDIERDKVGFTHPNLHRRVDPKVPDNDVEVESKKYSIGIYSLNSYRTTEKIIHDEESEDKETP